MSRTKDNIIEESITSSHNTKSRALLVFLTLMVAVGVIAMALSALALYRSLHSSAQTGADLAAQVKQACLQKGHQTPQIRRLCNNAEEVIQDSPLESVSPSPGPAGDVGDQGPGPSNAQVALAVANFCSGNNCDGPGPSATQVAQAVTLFCNANGECRGPEGAPGAPGQNATGAPGPSGVPGADATGAPGAPGAAGPDGPQGPPPTDQQVADAVNNFCSTRNNCQGPEGPQGPQGPPGVVDVVTDASCNPGLGLVIDSVNASYDQGTQTITLTCTSVGAVLPGNGNGARR